MVELQRALRRQTATPAADARRKDAREKIELGGLVVKAGLREADKAFLLGVLLDAAERQSDGEFKAGMIARGRKGFSS
nr:conjugal transfer protein TraD [Aureimonas ureilytica]